MAGSVNVRVWRRADGWFEIDINSFGAWPNRFKTEAEVDGFLRGLQAGYALARSLVPDQLDVSDERPIRAAPPDVG